MNFFKKNILSALTCILIIYASLAPSSSFSDKSFILFQNDKLLHCLMYLFFMSVITYENRKRISKKSLLFIAIIVLAFSGALEFLQFSITVSRTGSYGDILANAIGIVFSLLPTFFFEPIKKRVF